MLGKRKAREQRSMVFNSGGATTLISADAEIQGDIEFGGDLEIQGVVRGNIRARAGSAATVRVIENGRVEGDIVAPRVVVNGLVVGEIHAAEQIDLAAKAQVKGNVHYRVIEMAKGAQVNGSLLHTAAAVEKEEDPVEIPPFAAEVLATS